MIDDKKEKSCESNEEEKIIAEDSRVLLQVDDKLIGDDKIIPGLSNEPDKKPNTNNDAVY
jgi:hypothetical protein